MKIKLICNYDHFQKIHDTVNQSWQFSLLNQMITRYVCDYSQQLLESVIISNEKLSAMIHVSPDISDTRCEET